MWLLVGWLVGLGLADGLDTQPLGQPIGEGFTCPQHRNLCTRSDYVGALQGTWTATLDEHGLVHSVTFSALWLPYDFPTTQHVARRTRQPQHKAHEAFEDLEHRHRSWDLLHRAEQPRTRVFVRNGEQRTLLMNTSALTNEAGETFLTASVLLQRTREEP